MDREAFDLKRKLDGEKAVEVLAQIQKMNPYLRVGQIIANATTGCDLFFVENDVLIELLEQFYFSPGKTAISDFKT